MKRCSLALTLACLLSLILTADLLCAAPDATRPDQPKTRLGAMYQRSGTLLIKGFTKAGWVDSQSGSVEVDCIVLIDSGTGERLKGLVVTVQGKGGLQMGASGTAFVDLDEIDGLLKAIDSIRRVTPASTPLADVEALYRTNGGLCISALSVTSHMMGASVHAGNSPLVQAGITLAQISELWAIMSEAKQTLDRIE
jgi:hypothetical protein